MENRIKKGFFFVIDGGEGVGKSTLIKHLQRVYENSDQVVFTREPGGVGSVMAEEIRHLMLTHSLSKQNDAKTMFGLILASRAAHMKDVVIPALDAGKHVIMDRGDSSTMAYQIYGPEAHYLIEPFWLLRDIYLKNFFPDLYIILDLDPKIGLARKAGQKDTIKNHFDEAELEFHYRVRKGYLNFARHPGIKSEVLDVEKLSEGGVAEKVKNILFNFP